MAQLKNTVKFDYANLLIVCHFSFHYEMSENNHLQDLKIISDAYFIGTFLEVNRLYYMEKVLPNP